MGYHDNMNLDHEQFTKAKEIAYRLLAVRSRSKAEIRERLKRKGISSEVIDHTIQLLTEYRYLDDRQFAQSWLDNRKQIKPMGRKRIYYELLDKGVAPEIISETLQDLTIEQEKAMAQELIERKLQRASAFEMNKARGFLLRRGFSPEVVNWIIQVYFKEHNNF